jgi:hypothetical protein
MRHTYTDPTVVLNTSAAFRSKMLKKENIFGIRMP